MKSNFHAHYSAKLFLYFVFFGCVSLSGFAQDTNPPSALSALLPSYYSIKDALVKSDANTAAGKAAEFTKVVKAVNIKTLSNSDMAIFMPLQDQLADDATKIANTSDIKYQRVYFASFSTNIFTLAKRLKLTNQPVYYDYCPMKKAYWLSSEASIKNPYFGSAMLTCGKTTETLK